MNISGGTDKATTRLWPRVGLGVVVVLSVIVGLMTSSLDRIGAHDEHGIGSDNQWCVIGVADDDVLNMRDGAGVDHTIIREVRHDSCELRRTAAATAATAGSSRWFEVTAGGQTGWVNSNYIEPARRWCVSDVAHDDTLNIRAHAGTKHAVVNELVHDSCVAFTRSAVISKTVGSSVWYRITVAADSSTTEGWVNSRHLESAVRWCVADVAKTDVLNLRTHAGIDNAIAKEIPHNSCAVYTRATPTSKTVGNSTWYRVTFDDHDFADQGWVNGRFVYRAPATCTGPTSTTDCARPTSSGIVVPAAAVTATTATPTTVVATTAPVTRIETPEAGAIVPAGFTAYGSASHPDGIAAVDVAISHLGTNTYWNPSNSTWQREAVRIPATLSNANQPNTNWAYALPVNPDDGSYRVQAWARTAAGLEDPSGATQDFAVRVPSANVAVAAPAAPATTAPPVTAAPTVAAPPVTTPSVGGLKTPLTCDVTRSADRTRASLTITAAPADGAKIYVFERRQDTEDWRWVQHIEDAAATFTDPKLTPSTDYSYRVRSRSNGGTLSAPLLCGSATADAGAVQARAAAAAALVNVVAPTPGPGADEAGLVDDDATETATPPVVAPTATTVPPAAPVAATGREIVIAIDPGHGAIEQRDGSLGFQREIALAGVREDILVLDISRRLRDLLESDQAQQNYRVYLTREDDRAPFAPIACGVPCGADLRGRVRFAASVDANLFVSIHTNASEFSRFVPNATLNQAEVYRSNKNGKSSSIRAFEESLADAVLANLEAIGLNNGGTRTANFTVLTSPDRPSILIEAGYHTGAQDAPRLATPEFRQEIAQAIFEAIESAN